MNLSTHKVLHESVTSITSRSSLALRDREMVSFITVNGDATAELSGHWRDTADQSLR